MDTNYVIRALIHDKMNERNYINNSEHITMLEGGNTARNSSNVRREQTARKSVVIPRHQHRTLGLHTLPKTAVSYLDLALIHRFWKRYARETLGIEPGDVLPTVYERGHDPICQALMKIDLHGARIKVLESKCETVVGLIGVVVLETKNIFRIVSTDDRLRSIPKQDSVFCITIGNIEVVAYGKQLLKRNAEHSVKEMEAILYFNSVD